jgi:p-hydroxybenzoate 3-monooxygenase
MPRTSSRRPGPRAQPRRQRRALRGRGAGRVLQRGDADAIAGYSAKALARVWKAERFSWSLTRLMHRFPEDGPFERAMQVAELDYIASSNGRADQHAENYVGLPV